MEITEVTNINTLIEELIKSEEMIRNEKLLTKGITVDKDNNVYIDFANGRGFVETMPMTYTYIDDENNVHLCCVKYE